MRTTPLAAYQCPRASRKVLSVGLNPHDRPSGRPQPVWANSHHNANINPAPGYKTTDNTDNPGAGANGYVNPGLARSSC